MEGEVVAERRTKFLLRLATLVAGTVMPVSAVAVPAQATQSDTHLSNTAQKFVLQHAVVAEPPICEWARFAQWIQGFRQCAPAGEQSGTALPDLKVTLREVS